MRRIFQGVLVPVVLLAGSLLPAGAADERYQTVRFEEGEPASLLWDAGEEALYVADNENNQIWRWTDAAGLKKLATTPDPEGARQAGATLVGQMARLEDGTFVVMRFGKSTGGFGGILYMNAAKGRFGAVPGLDPTRKRLGLAVAGNGRIFGSWFRGMGGSGHEGAVTTVDLEKGETDWATGFKKVSGLLADGDRLYVCDQLADAIYIMALGKPAGVLEERRVLAHLPRPDQLSQGPDGSLFVGQFRAAPGSSAPLAVRQVLADGTVKVFVQEPDVTRPNGLAYDAKGRRLFVANGGDPAGRSIRIFKVP